MKIKNPLKFCLVFIMLAGLFQFSYIFAFGQSCSVNNSPPIDKRGWQKGATVSVYINPDITGDVRRAVVAAFEIWNTANQINNSGVKFIFPTTPPEAGNNFYVNSGTNLFLPENPKDRLRAITQSYVDPTTGFNTSAMAKLDTLMTNYDAVFETMVHEIGHPAGLDHCVNSGCTSQTSIMTPMAKRGIPSVTFNEVFGRVTSPTACDNQVLEQLNPFFPCYNLEAEIACPLNGGLWDPQNCLCNLHDHSGGGGIGGGTGGSTGGGGGGVHCYDVYEASYYYGCVQGDPNCNESIDYKYVGIECEYAN